MPKNYLHAQDYLHVQENENTVCATAGLPCQPSQPQAIAHSQPMYVHAQTTSHMKTKQEPTTGHNLQSAYAT